MTIRKFNVILIFMIVDLQIKVYFAIYFVWLGRIFFFFFMLFNFEYLRGCLVVLFKQQNTRFHNTFAPPRISTTLKTTLLEQHYQISPYQDVLCWLCRDIHWQEMPVYWKCFHQGSSDFWYLQQCQDGQDHHCSSWLPSFC